MQIKKMTVVKIKFTQKQADTLTQAEIILKTIQWELEEVPADDEKTIYNHNENIQDHVLGLIGYNK